MNSITLWKNAVLSSLLLSLTAACGDGEDSGGDGDGDDTQDPGTVYAPYDAYCVATFTEDYDVIDVFDDTLFTAREGEQYLMSALMSSFGDGADLMFLTDAGPYDFSVSPDPETGTFPFTTNCTGEVTDYIAAFHDVTVYADEELTEELCTIAADTILPRDPGMQSGSWAVTLDFSDDNIYGVYLNAFAAQCGNVETGYVNAPETTVHRVTTWLIPIAGFVGPA